MAYQSAESGKREMLEIEYCLTMEVHSGDGLRFRVLLIEDHPLDVELLQMELTNRQLNCELVEVATREAFELAIDGTAFNLIVSDSRLPGFDGLSALAMAREKCPSVPFVFFSGSLSEKLRDDALAQGAVAYVDKGRMSDLVGLIRRLSSA